MVTMLHKQWHLKASYYDKELPNAGVEKPKSDHPIQIGQSFFEHPTLLSGFFTIADFPVSP
jgi:hypothetical protein